MKKRILFTGGGGAATEFLSAYLSKRYEVFFADACLDAIDDRISEKHKIEIPLASSEEFIDSLLDIVIDYSIDFLVPSVDEELIEIAENRHKFQCEILLPESGFIRSMLDKFECINCIAVKGLNHPLTLPVSDSGIVGFPQIVKPRSGRGSRGVSVINGTKDLAAYMIVNKALPDSLISQRLAVGTEYTVLVAADFNAELKAIVPVRIEQKKGITIRAETEKNLMVIKYCKEFQEKFQATGVYNLQCIVTPEGEVIPFEINPRISTTFCLSIAAGFDPFKMLEGENFEDAVFYPEKKFVLKRNWHNNIQEVK
ncbi:MAG: hypothetical protein OFPI_07910 [Osedax symbiont Rs2]|nr:MAG: hypothetical protein OFPI_07910 [Osedax symbiont Rs2]